MSSNKAFRSHLMRSHALWPLHKATSAGFFPSQVDYASNMSPKQAVLPYLHRTLAMQTTHFSSKNTR